MCLTLLGLLSCEVVSGGTYLPTSAKMSSSSTSGLDNTHKAHRHTNHQIHTLINII